LYGFWFSVLFNSLRGVFYDFAANVEALVDVSR